MDEYHLVELQPEQSSQTLLQLLYSLKKKTQIIYDPSYKQWTKWERWKIQRQEREREREEEEEAWTERDIL